MEKQHINPISVRQKAETEEGKKYSAELEEINWKIQNLVFEQCKLQCQYELKSLEYKKFLGYEIDETKVEQLKKELEQYDSTI